MREIDYLLATNAAKLRSARLILTEVLPGKDYGIDKLHFKQLRKHLDQLISHIHKQLNQDEP